MGNKIVILGTGGTIAGTAATPDDVTGYTAAQLGIAQLVAAVPALASVEILTEQVAQLDSKDMSHAAWQNLASRVSHWLSDASVRGVVITHGTDTLEETAYFLRSVLFAAKPVVLTCAMRPATALMADGPQNLMDAVAVARSEGARGVMVVCAGTVHAADSVQKIHTYRLDAFTSGDDGPLGFVEQGALRRVREWPVPPVAMAVPQGQWPRVDIILSHAGANGRIVELLVKDGVQGLVVAGTGNGTLHSDLEVALSEAVASGVRVVRTTRCALGRVYRSANGAGPFEDAGGLTPAKARVALMLQLASVLQRVQGP